MASMNKVILIGNLGSDPELKKSQSGKSYCHVGLATNEGRGENQTTEWHNLVLFDKQAEFLCTYMHKGDVVCVEGSIRTNKWQDKESGEQRERKEIRVYQVIAIGGKRTASGEPGADIDASEIPF